MKSLFYFFFGLITMLLTLVIINHLTNWQYIDEYTVTTIRLSREYYYFQMGLNVVWAICCGVIFSSICNNIFHKADKYEKDKQMD